jgi:drug/metabolite transporter (DMT)-like permease
MPTAATAHRPAAVHRRAAYTELLAVVVIWGLNFTVAKWSLREIPPLAFTAFRFILASVLLLALLHRREGTIRPPRGSVGRLTVLGLIGNTIYQICFIVGLSLTTVSNSALVLASMPAMVAALAFAFRLERVTARAAEGLGLASIGVVLVVAARGVSFGAGTLRGDVLTFAAVICWAVFTHGVRRLAVPMSPLAITTWTVVLATPLLVVAGLPSMLAMNWGAVSLLGWVGVVYASVLSLVLAYILWNDSIRAIGASRTAVFSCLTPLVAMSSAVLVLHERPTLVQLGGAAAILTGVLLSQRTPKPL